MLEEFPYEARMGWQLAFLRTFSSPRMAELLAGTGQLTGHTMKRPNDTADDLRDRPRGFASPRVPPAVVERAIDAALQAYGFVKRQRPGDDASGVFTPGMAVAGLYPRGYRLGELGPR